MTRDTEDVLHTPQCPVCRCPCKDGAHKRDHIAEYHPEAL